MKTSRPLTREQSDRRAAALRRSNYVVLGYAFLYELKWSPRRNAMAKALREVRAEERHAAA